MRNLITNVFMFVLHQKEVEIHVEMVFMRTPFYMSLRHCGSDTSSMDTNT